MDTTASAPRIAEIVVADEPGAWRSAGFTVDGDRCQVGEVTIRLVGRERGKRIQSWTLTGLAADAADLIDAADPTNLDGLATSVVADVDAASATSPGVHPNGALIIDHIVILTPNQQRTTAAIEAIGLPALRTRETDQYGAPFLQTFFRAGEVIVELIGPAEPSGDGPTVFFGLAYTVGDLDALAALLGDGVGAIKDAVQPGRRITTLRHKTFDVSVATAFMSAGAAADGVDPAKR